MTGFAKPALTTDQQVQLLRSRGMHIADAQRAKECLHHINYYRLRAYWLFYESGDAGASGEHRFVKGCDFDEVLAIYDFDRALRVLLLDAIERVEISLRTRLANELALRHGPFAHEDAHHFAKQGVWQQSLDELRKEYQRSRETFAEHYRSHYPEMSSPPIWVACELMTLGHLSRWLQNMARPQERQAIANAYGLDEKVLVSFAHHLTVVRNHCAHHGRVWNRKFSLQMLIPGKKPAGLSAAFNPAQPRRIYNTLAMLAHLLRCLEPRSHWPARVKHLIRTSPQIDTLHMGFPVDWKQLAIWQEPNP